MNNERSCNISAIKYISIQHIDNDFIMIKYMHFIYIHKTFLNQF
jgi:hypothetical protein